jgi:type III secretion protein T
MDAAFELQAWSNALQNGLLIILLHSIRFYTASLLIPPLSGEGMAFIAPALALIAGGLAAMGASQVDLNDFNRASLIWLIPKEALLGLLLGYGVATIFWVVESVGAFLDAQSGFNSVQQNNPTSNEQNTPLSNLLSQLATTLFYGLGGLQAVLALLFKSQIWWPVLSPVPGLDHLMLNVVSNASRDVLILTITYGMGIAVLLTCIDWVMGLISRSADKLDPSSMTQPMKGAVTLIALSSALIAGQESFGQMFGLAEVCPYVVGLFAGKPGMAWNAASCTP